MSGLHTTVVPYQTQTSVLISEAFAELYEHTRPRFAHTPNEVRGTVQRVETPRLPARTTGGKLTVAGASLHIVTCSRFEL